ncbi:hypothetical protein ABAC460_13610 [Asticcacaulis sp. AC460]|uniref:serine hydrolase domain-containing protein n=1 Tax=Asticcacaulis sp. AC460 TaxID=1282360 RepID=UPI0003C3EEB3|nr:serine hydrolase domain-containing protein [Asticcacaulis sp. AC460]ESQ89101.1 hypothetical protein ABAC460_13610 [Asticcacaulis sp. AC460]
MSLASLALYALLSSAIPAPADIDSAVHKAMADTGAKGLAIAVIDNGKVAYTQAYGIRNTNNDPLTPDTIMYGASLTKTVMAYTALQLVDQGKLNLDTPIADVLPKPLPDYPEEPKYADYAPLKTDPRWRNITPRIILTHSTGFANFGFLEPDGKLRIHFDPGARYAYSGDGIILLQFAIEKGLNLDVGQLTQTQFDRLGMARTSLIWRPDFAGNLADGWGEEGQTEPHDERSKVRAAGSMDTTITDIAKFTAALVRGDGLTANSRAELSKPQLHITTRSQFNSFQPELPPEQQRKDLYAGLGVVVFDGPQGPGFYKGGHNDTTGNTMVCIEKGQRCVVILANDVRAEKAFPDLIKLFLGDTGVPYDWEYGFTPSAE